MIGSNYENSNINPTCVFLSSEASKKRKALFEDKKDELTKEKERLKEFPKEPSNLSVKTFGILNGDAFLNHTGYEGQDLMEQLDYWLHCFALWLDASPQGIFQPAIDQADLNNIVNNLQSFHEACRKFDNSQPKEICNYIAKQLKEKQECIIPLQTMGAKGGRGHAFSCVLEQDDEGCVTATILNVGAGADMHPFASLDVHLKRSFMFPPIRFNEGNFFNTNPEVATYFIQMLLDFRNQEPEIDYNLKEIYQLFLELGKVTSIEAISGSDVQGQRSGTCSAKTMKLNTRYHFFKKHDIDSYKKVVFYLVLQSHWDIYSQIVNDHVDLKSTDIALIKRSLIQFASRIDKLSRQNPRLVNDDVILTGQALIELIHEELRVESYPEINAEDFTTHGNTLFQITLPDSLELKREQSATFYPYGPDSFTCPTPTNLCSYLEYAISNYQITATTVDEYNKSNCKELLQVRATFCMEILKKLPVPELQEEYYWNAVPVEDRISIMQNITRLVQSVDFYDAHVTDSKLRTAQVFLAHLSALAIIDWFSRKNPRMELDGLSYKLPLEQLQKQLYFRTGSDNARFDQLVTYFAADANSPIIFDIRAFGAAIKFDRENKEIENHSHCTSGLGGHLRYLDRMIPSDQKKNEALYLKLISNEQSNLLPSEYYLLQYAFLSTESYLSESNTLAPANYNLQNTLQPSMVFCARGDTLILRAIKEYCIINYPLNMIISSRDAIDSKKNSKTCDGSEHLKSLENYYQQAIKDNVVEENHAVINSKKNYPNFQDLFRILDISTQFSGLGLGLKNENKEDSLANSILCEVQKVFKNPKTRSSLAMKFAQDYPAQISDPELQYLIQVAFLNGSHLIQQIRHEPSYASTLRGFCDKMIERSRWNHHPDETIFWLHLSLLIETHLTEALNKDIPEERLQSLLAECEKTWIILNEDNETAKKQIFLTKALILGTSVKEWDEHKDAARIAAFLNNYLLCKLYETAMSDQDPKKPLQSALDQLLTACFCRHSASIKACLNSSSPSIFEPVLSYLGIHLSAEKGSLVSHWPQYSFVNGSGTKVEIRFPHLYIDGARVELGQWPLGMQKHNQIKAILRGQFPPVVKTGQDKVIAQDGSFEISLLNNNSFDFKLKFKIREQELFLTYLDVNKLKIEHMPDAFKENTELWQDKDSGIIWMLDSLNRHPFARIVGKGDGCVIQKINKHWKPVPNQNLVQVPEGILSGFFKNVYDPAQIVAWGSDTGCIDHVTLPLFDLSFNLERCGDRTRCLYEENRNYCLADHNDISSPLNSALYLEKSNDPRKKGMILPMIMITSQAFDSAAKAEINSVMAREHFFYELDVKNGLWHSSCPLAMLYLVYALQRHGRYEEAYVYLSNNHLSAPFNCQQVLVLKEMQKNNCESRSLCIAIQAFIAYHNADNLRSFNYTQDDTPPFEGMQLKGAAGRNVARLIQLMGEDLSVTRLYYSPTIEELIPIVDKLTSLYSLKMYGVSDFEIQLLHRFSQRCKKKGFLEIKGGIPESTKDINLRLILNIPQNRDCCIPFFMNRNESFIDKLKRLEKPGQFAPFPKLIRDNKRELDDILLHYLNILLHCDLTEHNKQEINLDVSLLLERYEPQKNKDNKQETNLDVSLLLERYDPQKNKDNPKESLKIDNGLAILFYASRFPSLFRTYILTNGLSIFSLENFLKHNALKEAARETFAFLSVSGNESIIVPTVLNPTAATDKQPSQIDPKCWHPLKAEFTRPLGDLKQKYLESSILPTMVGHPEFALISSAEELQNDEVAAAKLKELATAYRHKVPKTYVKYHLKENLTAADLTAELKSVVTKSEEAVRCIETEIHTIISYPSTEELGHFVSKDQKAVFLYRTQVRQGKIDVPSFQKHVLPSFLLQRADILKNVNPFLSAQQIAELYELVVRYMLEHSRIDQAQLALSDVNYAQANPAASAQALHNAGLILSKERHYNPYKYPEILIYEYATGHMLRNEPDQAIILKKIIKTLFDVKRDPLIHDKTLRRLFFEFQAGGGKTKVLSVILAARAQREDKIPVFFSLPSLFDIVKADLRSSFQQAYHLGVVPISIPLSKNLRHDDILALKNVLNQKGICIVTEPETWHSLRLQWQNTLSVPFAKTVQENRALLEEIFDNFKTRGLFFIDEENRNVSSMTEANQAYGQSSPLPDYQSDLIRKCYDVLFGWIDEPIMLSNGKHLHSELGIAENRQVFLSSELKKEILDSLAEYLMPFLNVPTEHYVEILAYLKDKRHPTPRLFEEIKLKKDEPKQEIQREDEELFCRKIDLARGLIGWILPHAFSQKGLMDYGPSPDVNDDVFDPYILGDPAGPKFQDPDIAAALTVQGLRQQGLQIQQIKRYLEMKLGQLHLAKNSGISEVRLLVRDFKALGPPHKYPLETLEIKDLNNPELLEAYHNALAKNRHVVQEYEQQFALKSIKVYPFKLSSTSQELSQGAGAVVHTSATLGVPEENPYIEDLSGLFLTSPEFMANVVQRALLPHNQEHHWVEESTPRLVLEQLYDQGVDFSHVDGIINMGGMCKNASSTEWEEALLDLNEEHRLGYAGVIIAKSERVGNAIEKRLYITMPGQFSIPVEGSDVKLALNKLNLSGLRFFKIYPPEMTTGTDLSLAENAKMLFTIGQNISFAAYIQAIMRMRGFLLNPIDPATSQSLIWVGSKHMEVLLKGLFKEASSRTAFINSILCQVAQEKEAFRMRALQDIEMVIRAVVEEIVKSQPNSYFQHKRAFEIPMGNNPSAKYGAQAISEDTETFLWRHAKEFAERANVELEKFPASQERIALAIKQTKKKLSMMESTSTVQFGATLYQQQEAQQHQKQQQTVQQRALNCITPLGDQPSDEMDYADGVLAFGQRTALLLNPIWQANNLLPRQLAKLPTTNESSPMFGLHEEQFPNLLSRGSPTGTYDKIRAKQAVFIDSFQFYPTIELTIHQLAGSNLGNFARQKPLTVYQQSSLLPDPSYKGINLSIDNKGWFLPSLYLLPNFYQTTTDSDPGKDLKPTTFILATLDKATGRRDYRVISTADARKYSVQLQNKNRHSETKQTGIIFTTNGAIHQTDRSAIGLSSEEVEDWMKSDEFRLILAQVGLIDGRCIEEERQWKLIQDNPEVLDDLQIIWENHLLRDDEIFQQNVTSIKNMLKRPFSPF